MAEPPQAQAVAEENVRCPDGMPRDVFSQLKKPYDQACDRVRKGPNFSEATQEKNKKKLEAAKKLLLEQLNHFKVNPELRSLIAAGNATSQSILQALNTNHNAVSQRLGNIETSTASLAASMAILAAAGTSPSSSEPVPVPSVPLAAVTAAILSLPDPDGECVVCFDPLTFQDAGRMMCCYRPESVEIAMLCKECLAEKWVEEASFKCPKCRREPAPISLGANCPLPNHQLASASTVYTLLKQYDPEDDLYGDKYEYHTELDFSGAVQMANPFWLDVNGASDLVRHAAKNNDGVIQPVRVLSLCSKTDEIGTFIQRFCDGKFPKMGRRVRVTFGDIKFPSFFEFHGFKRTFDKETEVVLRAPYDEGYADHLMGVPLSAIGSFKDEKPWFKDDILKNLRTGSRFSNDPECSWMMVQFVRDGPWQRCWLKDVVEGAGPSLILSPQPDSQLEQVVSYALIENVWRTDFVELDREPFSVYGLFATRLPLNCKVLINLKDIFQFAFGQIASETL